MNVRSRAPRAVGGAAAARTSVRQPFKIAADQPKRTTRNWTSSGPEKIFMSHSITGVGGIGDLSYTLINSRQHHEDLGDILRRRQPDVVKDKVEPAADRFTKTHHDDDADKRLRGSLRALADRYKGNAVAQAGSPDQASGPVQAAASASA